MDITSNDSRINHAQVEGNRCPRQLPTPCAQIAQRGLEWQLLPPMGTRSKWNAKPVWVVHFALLLVVGLVGEAAHAETKTFDVVIRDGEVQGEQTLRVSQGDDLRIEIQSDSALELHLHGYDIKVHVEPGAIATLSLDAKVAGRFAIEAHGHSHTGSGHRTLLYLEVHPR